MDRRYERIVVPVAGTTADERAIALVKQVVDKQPVDLTLIYVVEVLQSMPLDAELPSEIAYGEAALRRAELVAKQALGAKMERVFTELLQARAAGSAVVDEAIERNADAIVMTGAIRRRHGRPTLGETVNYILMNAPCDVLVVREAVAAPAGNEATWR